MFAETKLRRGMIPKDKEGGLLNFESWGRATCHLSLLLPPPWFFGWWIGIVNWLEKRTCPCLLTLSLWCVCWLVHYPDREPVQFLHARELKESTFHCWGFAFSLRISSQWVFFPIHAEDNSPLPHEFEGWWIVSLLWSRRECVFFHHWHIS